MARFDWNDLKYLIAVARAGSTLAAGRLLGVNQSTVQRRLAELEARLGVGLIERLPSGYRLTRIGKAVLPAAEAVAGAAEAFEQAVARAAPVDVLRLSCPEPIATRLMASGLLERFRARHPEIRVEFVLSDRYVDLAAGEADVALRSGEVAGDLAGDLVGRKIAESVWAIYASRAYLASLDPPGSAPGSVAELAAHPLIALDETHARHRLSEWLREALPEARFAARANSVLGLVASAKAGVGLAPLPTALGDAEPDLVRVLGPIPALARDWRILAMPVARRLPRVAALFDFVAEEAEAVRRVLGG